MQAVAVRQAVAALRAAYDVVDALPIDALTTAELLPIMDDLEALSSQLPSQRHRMLAQLQTETTATAIGATSWNEVLRSRWRLTPAEASRRLADAAELGPRRRMTGEPLQPVLPATAAAQSAGMINGEHVKVLRDAVTRLPGVVDATTREQFELDLVRVAVGVGPKELKDAADLRVFLLDQDGPEPHDTERVRKRGVSRGTQGRDAMTPLTAHLTPEAWAVWEVLFARDAAPGMCNPDDPEPCTSGTPSQAQIDGDHRSLAQRQHDALLAIGRIALMSGDLGKLNGLPVTVIIRTTLQDLESRAGIGVTGGGTVIPITDVVRMGAHAHHELAVFDRATGSALDLFRARRTASPAQRIMLIARDGGCTKPSCTVGAYGSQVHHAKADWANGGNTNVDEMALACGSDNRSVGDGGYTTTINTRGDVEWHPPPRPGQRPSPHQLLPPPRTPPTSTRRANTPRGQRHRRRPAGTPRTRRNRRRHRRTPTTRPPGGLTTPILGGSGPSPVRRPQHGGRRVWLTAADQQAARVAVAPIWLNDSAQAPVLRANAHHPRSREPCRSTVCSPPTTPSSSSR